MQKTLHSDKTYELWVKIGEKIETHIKQIMKDNPKIKEVSYLLLRSNICGTLYRIVIVEK